MKEVRGQRSLAHLDRAHQLDSTKCKILGFVNFQVESLSKGVSVVHQYRVQQDSPAVSDHGAQVGQVDPPQVEVENEVVTGLHHQRANLQTLSE